MMQKRFHVESIMAARESIRESCDQCFNKLWPLM